MKKVILTLTILSSFLFSESHLPTVNNNAIKVKTVKEKEIDREEEALKAKLNENSKMINDLFKPISERKVSKEEKKFKLNLEINKYKVELNEITYNASKNLLILKETHVTMFSKDSLRNMLNDSSVCNSSSIHILALKFDPNIKINYIVYFEDNKKEENKILDKTIVLKDCF